MNFFTIIITGYILVAALLAYFFIRDSCHPQTFLGKHKKLAKLIVGILIAGMLLSLYARLIEPYWLVVNEKTISLPNIKDNIKIALVTDLQLNKLKNENWVKKITQKIEKINPDLVLIGGDIIDNEGDGANEIQYIDTLRELAQKYPVYYIMGNHEYGIGRRTRGYYDEYTGDRSTEVKQKMNELGAKLLLNELACPQIRQQTICIYGIDDIWTGQQSFTGLNQWDKITPLIFLTHNPDGILDWPEKIKFLTHDREIYYWKDEIIKRPDLTLAGHTHGGQVWLPFWGPVGEAGVELGKQYYRGLKNYQGALIYITSGAGESGGPVRFLTPPEVAVITLMP